MLKNSHFGSLCEAQKGTKHWVSKTVLYVCISMYRPENRLVAQLSEKMKTPNHYQYISYFSMYFFWLFDEYFDYYLESYKQPFGESVKTKKYR